VLNSVNATLSGGNKHRLDIDALQCPIAGCPVPPPPVCLALLLRRCT
jgi:hypothetical protein